jgi:2-methylaconitate cis-trans-isomerase PrpF
MGSPDPYGRQLDGMGSGISSTSKICILSPSADSDVADVDFTFVQVGVKDGSLDMASNCGNMLSVVGPVAFDGGIAAHCKTETDTQTGERTAVVRILNTNTRKVVRSRFRVSGEPPSYSQWGHTRWMECPGSDRG